MTDASGAQLVKLSGFDMPKLGVLNINAIYAGLHYGSFVTSAAKEHRSSNRRAGFRP